jgi:hypothetical protein
LPVYKRPNLSSCTSNNWAWKASFGSDLGTLASV